jgi:outer membrane protein assembly complex protein YaeT
MLLALLLITAPASLQIDGADPALHERLHRMLLPLWRRSLDAERVAKRLRSVYMRSGRFLTEVEHEVEGEALRLIVSPSKQARIQSVRFLGNAALSDEELGKAMFNRLDSASARLQGLGNFLPEALTDDVTGLRQAYFAKGYIFAKIKPPRVYVDPDLNAVRLEVSVVEGERFNLGKLAVTGLPEGERFAFATGQAFSVSGIHAAVEKVRLAWMRRGHALVQVKERSEVDAAGNSVSLWLDFVAGPLCRIEALEWVGVTKVETAVLSRLMRIHAGDRYDHGLLLEEIGRLRSLGLIMGAQIVTAEGAKPDAVRVRLVGQDAMQKWYPAFTMTYLPGEGAVLLLQLSTPNLLGKGIRFRGSSWLSSERRLFDLSIGVPALLHPLDNLGFEIHNRDRKYPILQAQSRGFSASYGRSLDRRRRWSVFTTLGIDYWDLSSFTASETVAFDEPNVGIQTSYGLSYDDRDSGLLGTRGQRLSLSLDLAPSHGRNGLSFSAQRLQRLPFGFRGRAKFSARQQSSASDPQFALYMGGPGTLRGYYAYTVAPRLSSGEFVGLPIGGDRSVNGGLELGYGLNSVLEPFVFLDGGNAFRDRWFEQPSSPRRLYGGLAWSWGFGLLLRLPVLPFRFEWGRPLTRGPGDPEMLFSLGIGTN